MSLVCILSKAQPEEEEEALYRLYKIVDYSVLFAQC